MSSLQIAIKQNFKTWEVHFSWQPGCFNDAVEIEHDFWHIIIGCDKNIFFDESFFQYIIDCEKSLKRQRE